MHSIQWFFSFLTTILVLLSLGSDCENRRLDALDEGLYSSPAYIPWSVTVGGDEARSFVDSVRSQVAWWNGEAPLSLVVFHYEDYSYPPETEGVIEVRSGYVGDWVEDAWGIFDYAERDGFLIRGEIIISSDILYDEATVDAILRHELGHALGLADDPRSIDLNSVMSSPLLLYGELTEGDYERLEDLFLEDYGG